MKTGKNVFTLVSDFKPCGDQPRAVSVLSEGILGGRKHQTLLGVTGSGKTFSIANVIARCGLPAIVISHNKTLAAQLFTEFKRFFPRNAVEYFVSYYDYYQPEAYIPQTDTYIEKDSSINDELDRLRLSATSSLLERKDVIMVASVSAIYGLGSPEDYRSMYLLLEKGGDFSREEIISRLINMQYERSDYDFLRGRFRVRGDRIDVFPAYTRTAFRVEEFAGTVKIVELDPLTGKPGAEKDKLSVYPAKHFAAPGDRIEKAMASIKTELTERLGELNSQGKLLEAQRLKQRTMYDMEMIREIGYCQGIENYSRHLSAREKGEPPFTLLDYFPDEYITVIDESHVTLPQVRGMYFGDRSRKETLVSHGFRLPSALDNRPLEFNEFEKKIFRAVYVSATPGPYELEKSGGVTAEQVIRPTGLVDPVIVVKPAASQVDDLIERVRERTLRGQRVLVSALTKRTAEDLSEYMREAGLNVRHLHSEIETLERIEIIRSLRLKEFDCLVGVNLLREGLDLPEVSLVAILDADKEGFLRSQTSIIQTAGRAARNVDGEVILYADRITGSMRRAMDETARRRKKQTAYNKKNNITPRSIQRAIEEKISVGVEAAGIVEDLLSESGLPYSAHDPAVKIKDLEKQMFDAAENLQFEKAAGLRDAIARLKKEKDENTF